MADKCDTLFEWASKRRVGSSVDLQLRIGGHLRVTYEFIRSMPAGATNIELQMSDRFASYVVINNDLEYENKNGRV